MFDQKEIFKMLQNGTDANEIADQFTKALNAAVKEDKEQKDNKTEKVKIVNSILGLVSDLLSNYYPDLYEENLYKDVFDPEAMVDELDKAYKDAKKMYSFFKDTDPVEKKNDPISAFLKEFNLN